MSAIQIGFSYKTFDKKHIHNLHLSSFADMFILMVRAPIHITCNNSLLSLFFYGAKQQFEIVDRKNEQKFTHIILINKKWMVRNQFEFVIIILLERRFS